MGWALHDVCMISHCGMRATEISAQLINKGGILILFISIIHAEVLHLDRFLLLSPPSVSVRSHSAEILNDIVSVICSKRISCHVITLPHCTRTISQSSYRRASRA